jgi:hypothetical protein
MQAAGRLLASAWLGLWVPRLSKPNRVLYHATCIVLIANKMEKPKEV